MNRADYGALLCVLAVILGEVHTNMVALGVAVGLFVIGAMAVKKGWSDTDG